MMTKAATRKEEKNDLQEFSRGWLVADFSLVCSSVSQEALASIKVVSANYINLVHSIIVLRSLPKAEKTYLGCCCFKYDHGK